MNSRWPIRMRLACGAASQAALVIVVFALAVYAHMRAELFEEVDLELVDFGKKISAAGSAAVVPSHTRIRMVTSDSTDDAGLVAAAAEAGAGAEPFTYREARGAWRLLRVAEVGAGTDARLLAYDLEEVDDVLDELVLVCLVAGLVLITGAATAGWWWSGRVLAPVRALKEAAEEIDAGALHLRVPLPLAHDELRRLGEVLNAMLARIEAGFSQSRRFTADASHELRTPLTIMRGELDRVLHEKNLDPALEARLLRVQEAAARLQRLTENLLLLARLDASVATGPALAEVDFSALVREACEDGAILAEARGVSLEIELADGALTQGDADGLRRVVLNLLDNATRYNRPEGRVWCRLERVGEGGVRLLVGNTGPGMPASVRERLFQRFMRGDAARVAGGHGLGLALSHEIARAHQGELRLLQAAEPDSTEFELVLPARRAGLSAGTSTARA